MNWRPIKSAPKDGTHILLCYPSFADDTDPPIVGMGRWTAADWRIGLALITLLYAGSMRTG